MLLSFLLLKSSWNKALPRTLQASHTVWSLASPSNMHESAHFCSLEQCNAMPCHANKDPPLGALSVAFRGIKPSLGYPLHRMSLMSTNYAQQKAKLQVIVE